MSEDLAGILKRYGVLLEGHFLLASGRHSGQYFEKFRILEHPDLCRVFAGKIVERFRAEQVTVVCGPTTGGVIIAYEVARQLGTRCIIAERAESGRKVGRGFRISADDRILVVDDVMTTGGSVVDTLDALKQFPGRVAGIGLFIDRSGGENRIPLPYYAVYVQTAETFEPDKCPLCKAGVEVTVPGRGRSKG